MSERVSALANHHRALGSDLGDWNGMGVAWNYASDACDEHDAVREAAGLFDVSGLKKIHVRGEKALSVVDHIITRDMTSIYVGKSAYGPILAADGGICDDAIIAHIDDNEFLVVHGSGETMERLTESASGKNVSIEFDDDLHDISLQGPKALNVLEPHTPIDLSSLNYFHQQQTTLFDRPVILSRTGYSGERGYEIFASATDVVPIWEEIVDLGKPLGVIPCSFAGLDKIRVEAALLFYPYDMTRENTPWEVSLGWAISRKKGDFRGKEAVFAREGKDKVKLVGIVAQYDDAVEEGADLSLQGRKVGVVNSPSYSHRMNKSLALAHVEPSASTVGTLLELKGDNISCTAVVENLPFYDREKTHTHS